MTPIDTVPFAQTVSEGTQEPSTAQRVVDVAATGLDVVAAGVQVAAQSGEAVAAGCDVFGVLFEGVLGLLCGLFQ